MYELLSENYECVEAASAEEALTLLKIENFNLVVSDINMTGISLQMIPQIRELAPDTIVIMISGEQNIENAVNPIPAEAFEILPRNRQSEISVPRLSSFDTGIYVNG